MADEQDRLDKERSTFLIAMYNQMMNDINRHIVVVWQSVGVLFAAFAAFALVEKKVIPLDIAISLIVFVCAWVIAHVYDAAYWYNRNLVIIANIERQFLKVSDLREIHYYFGEHRRAGEMITHLGIQKWLAVGVAGLVLLFHYFTVVSPAPSFSGLFTTLAVLPWISAVGGLGAWRHSHNKGVKRYKTFLQNSPGKDIDASGIKHGPGHPV